MNPPYKISSKSGMLFHKEVHLCHKTACQPFYLDLLSTVFVIENKKTLCDSFRRPSRSDFVQSEYYVQCRNALSVMILAKISPSGSAIMIIRADTSHGAERDSDISPML